MPRGFRIRVVDKDKGFSAIMVQTKSLSMRIRVGIDARAPSEVLLRAMVHEFGAPTAGIPQRSFLAWTMDKHRKRYLREMYKICDLAMQGKGIKRAQDTLGKTMVMDVLKRIKSNIAPPLTEATVERKGHDLALVDTSEMFNNITWRLTKR